jgi:hypothetical protein
MMMKINEDFGSRLLYLLESQRERISKERNGLGYKTEPKSLRQIFDSVVEVNNFNRKNEYSKRV